MAKRGPHASPNEGRMRHRTRAARVTERVLRSHSLWLREEVDE
jgi:hypothetical protein